MILLLVAVAWLAGGVLAATGLDWAWPLVLLTSVGAAGGFVAAQQKRDAVLAIVLGAVCLAGLGRYESARPGPPSGVALLNDGAAVSLRGFVSEEPEQRPRSQRLTLKVSQVDEGSGWRDIDGKVQVTTRLFPPFEYGDVLEVRGKLETPPQLDGFDYRDYLARKGVGSLSAFPSITRTGDDGGTFYRRALEDLRRSLGDSLTHALPEPEAALAKGILLGQRSSIPEDVNDDFNRAGISHLIAISGQNVSIVGQSIILALCLLIGRRPATLVAIVLIWLYAFFVGESGSVVRAAAMGSVAMGGMYFGRPNNALGLVFLSGALLTLWRPLLLDDVGFQLSFIATLGIVVVAKPLGELMTRRLRRLLPEAIAGWLSGTLAVTTAASCAVLPVIAINFGRVSVVALFANLFAVSAFVPVLATTFVAAVLGALSSTLGVWAGEVAYYPLAYLVLVADVFGSPWWASLSVGDLGSVAALVMYGAIAIAAALLLRVAKAAPVLDPPPTSLRMPVGVMVALPLFAIGGALFVGSVGGDDARLTVTVLDVGQGDSILIETPAGHRILVDGGPSGPALAQALGEQSSSRSRRFDLLVLTHGQDDHVSGLIDVLERYEVGGALVSPLDGETMAYRAWQASLASHGVPLHIAVAGESVDLGGGVRIDVLGPPPELLHGTVDDLNNGSVVLRLVYGDVSVLLTGDLAADGEAALLRGGGDLRSTVLKVGHHGSDGSTTAGLLAAVQPQLAVISAGASNTYGHPSPTTLLRLGGVPLLRTDINGDVRLETDGHRLWARYEHGTHQLVGAAR